MKVLYILQDHNEIVQVHLLGLETSDEEEEEM